MVNRTRKANEIKYFPPKRMPCAKDCACYVCQMRVRSLLRAIGASEPIKPSGRPRKLTARQITAAYYKP